MWINTLICAGRKKLCMVLFESWTNRGRNPRSGLDFWTDGEGNQPDWREPALEKSDRRQGRIWTRGGGGFAPAARGRAAIAPPPLSSVVSSVEQMA